MSFNQSDAHVPPVSPFKSGGWGRDPGGAERHTMGWSFHLHPKHPTSVNATFEAISSLHTSVIVLTLNYRIGFIRALLEF